MTDFKVGDRVKIDYDTTWWATPWKVQAAEDGEVLTISAISGTHKDILHMKGKPTPDWLYAREVTLVTERDAKGEVIAYIKGLRDTASAKQQKAYAEADRLYETGDDFARQVNAYNQMIQGLEGLE